MPNLPSSEIRRLQELVASRAQGTARYVLHPTSGRIEVVHPIEGSTITVMSVALPYKEGPRRDRLVEELLYAIALRNAFPSLLAEIVERRERDRE